MLKKGVAEIYILLENGKKLSGTASVRRKCSEPQWAVNQWTLMTLTIMTMLMTIYKRTC